MDNFYLVDAMKPDSYVTLESFALVDNLMLADENRLLFVAESTAVHAFDRERRLLWSRRIVNGYDLQLTRCADGVLVVDVERELGGPRREIHISTKDGTALIRRSCLAEGLGCCVPVNLRVDENIGPCSAASWKRASHDV